MYTFSFSLFQGLEDSNFDIDDGLDVDDEEGIEGDNQENLSSSTFDVLLGSSSPHSAKSDSRKGSYIKDIDILTNINNPVHVRI